MATVIHNEKVTLESVDLKLSPEEAAAIYAACVSFRNRSEVAVRAIGPTLAPMKTSYMSMLEQIAAQMLPRLPSGIREAAWRYRPEEEAVLVGGTGHP